MGWGRRLPDVSQASSPFVNAHIATSCSVAMNLTLLGQQLTSALTNLAATTIRTSDGPQFKGPPASQNHR